MRLCVIGVEYMALLDQNLADLMIEVPIEWEQMLYTAGRLPTVADRNKVGNVSTYCWRWTVRPVWSEQSRSRHPNGQQRRDDCTHG